MARKHRQKKFLRADEVIAGWNDPPPEEVDQEPEDETQDEDLTTNVEEQENEDEEHPNVGALPPKPPTPVSFLKVQQAQRRELEEALLVERLKLENLPTNSNKSVLVQREQGASIPQNGLLSNSEPQNERDLDSAAVPAYPPSYQWGNSHVCKTHQESQESSEDLSEATTPSHNTERSTPLPFGLSSSNSPKASPTLDALVLKTPPGPQTQGAVVTDSKASISAMPGLSNLLQSQTTPVLVSGEHIRLFQSQSTPRAWSTIQRTTQVDPKKLHKEKARKIKWLRSQDPYTVRDVLRKTSDLRANVTLVLQGPYREARFFTGICCDSVTHVDCSTCFLPRLDDLEYSGSTHTLMLFELHDDIEPDRGKYTSHDFDIPLWNYATAAADHIVFFRDRERLRLPEAVNAIFMMIKYGKKVLEKLVVPSEFNPTSAESFMCPDGLRYTYDGNSLRSTLFDLQSNPLQFQLRDSFTNQLKSINIVNFEQVVGNAHTRLTNLKYLNIEFPAEKQCFLLNVCAPLLEQLHISYSGSIPMITGVNLRPCQTSKPPAQGSGHFTFIDRSFESWNTGYGKKHSPVLDHALLDLRFTKYFQAIDIVAKQSAFVLFKCLLTRARYLYIRDCEELVGLTTSENGSRSPTLFGRYPELEILRIVRTVEVAHYELWIPSWFERVVYHFRERPDGSRVDNFHEQCGKYRHRSVVSKARFNDQRRAPQETCKAPSNGYPRGKGVAGRAATVCCVSRVRVPPQEESPGPLPSWCHRPMCQHSSSAS